MRPALLCPILAAAATLVYTAPSPAQYVLRTRFFTLELGRAILPPGPGPQALTTSQLTLPAPPQPVDPVAPAIPPQVQPPPLPPMPTDPESPLPVPRPVQPVQPAQPVLPPSPPYVEPGGGQVMSAALTPGQFARSFQPVPGIHEVILVHPYTGQPVPVRFALPNVPPRRIHADRHKIEFSYRAHRDVIIRFYKDGSVRVRN